MRWIRFAGCGAAASMWAAAATAAPVRENVLTPCQEAIHFAEIGAKLPPALLGAIGMVESGRVDPVTRRVTPWPWTINVEGTGYFFETRDKAITAVQSARSAGRRSIDVGCMQINLQHHPAAFASLEEAFDPRANAIYAATFLKQLFVQTQDWGNAAAAYHSQTPGVADEYRRRVVAGWSGAALYGVSQWPTLIMARQKREPEGGYTPEFRARLARDEADHRALQVSMGIATAPQHGSAMLAARPRSTLRLTLRD